MPLACRLADQIIRFLNQIREHNLARIRKQRRAERKAERAAVQARHAGRAWLGPQRSGTSLPTGHGRQQPACIAGCRFRSAMSVTVGVHSCPIHFCSLWRGATATWYCHLTTSQLQGLMGEMLDAVSASEAFAQAAGEDAAATAPDAADADALGCLSDAAGGGTGNRRRRGHISLEYEDDNNAAARSAGVASGAAGKSGPLPKLPAGSAREEEEEEVPAHELLSLEWLRDAPDGVARDYLMNIDGERRGASQGMCADPATACHLPAASWHCVRVLAGRCAHRPSGQLHRPAGGNHVANCNAPVCRPHSTTPQRTLTHLRSPPSLPPHLPAMSAGLGRKSVGCIMLLTLGKKEFPVDTNVGRICARCSRPPRTPPSVTCSLPGGSCPMLLMSDPRSMAALHRPGPREAAPRQSRASCSSPSPQFPRTHSLG